MDNVKIIPEDDLNFHTQEFLKYDNWLIPAYAINDFLRDLAKLGWNFKEQLSVEFDYTEYMPSFWVRKVNI